ncbi:MAG TPA: RND family transporter [Deltaproteobacteria bacterium]|nr:RND family transporter [Deltaproteobacteria bacterium]
MMRRIINFSVFHPYWIISCVTLITFFFALQIPHLKIDPRVEIILRDNNPVEKDYSANKKEFAPYADILIGMLHPDIYNVDSLKKIQAISEEASYIEGVRKVSSILNAKNIQGSISGLDVSPMFRDGVAPSTKSEIAELKERAHSWDVYEGVYITEEGNGTAISIVLYDDVETDQIVPIYYKLSDLMKKYEGPERFFISGTKVVEALQGHYMIKDLKLLPPLVCVVLLSFMFLFFRNLRGMLLPLVSVAIATIWSVGLMPLFDIPLTMVTTALPVALMGVGVAYGVHGVENIFSDAAEGKKGKSGITGAMNRIAVPVIMAGCTTMACFLSLCSTPVVPLSHFGMLCAFGIAVAMMLALTFIPAVLSVIDSRGKEYVPHHHTKRDIIGPVLKKISYINSERTRWVIAFYLGILVVSLVLGRHVKSDLNLIEDFRKSSPIRIADEILNENFGGTSMFNAVFSTRNPDDIKEPAVLYEMEQLQEGFKKHPDIGKAVSIVDFIKRINQAMNDGDPAFYRIPDSRELIAQYLLLFSFSGGGDELDSFVDYDYSKAQILLQMKSQSGYLANDIVQIVDDYSSNELRNETITGIITTGLAMLAKEFNRLVVRSQIQSFLISISLCFMITALIFRSYKLGFYSMIPLIIPIVLDFGIMGVSGIKLNAATATVACIDIGMGIDYSIHFLSRYRHEIRMGRTVDNALDISLNTSGRAIIYNALAVAAGFLVLVPSQFVIISQLGILVAVDMLTISISVLTFLPASIKLFPPNLHEKVPAVPRLDVPMKLVTPSELDKESAVVTYADKDQVKTSLRQV